MPRPIHAVTVGVSGTAIADEVVERLAVIGKLAFAAFARDGAEPGRPFLAGLDRRPDPDALSRASARPAAGDIVIKRIERHTVLTR